MPLRGSARTRVARRTRLCSLRLSAPTTPAAPAPTSQATSQRMWFLMLLPAEETLRARLGVSGGKYDASPATAASDAAAAPFAVAAAMARVGALSARPKGARARSRRRRKDARADPSARRHSSGPRGTKRHYCLAGSKLATAAPRLHGSGLELARWRTVEITTGRDGQAPRVERCRGSALAVMIARRP